MFVVLLSAFSENKMNVLRSFFVYVSLFPLPPPSLSLSHFLCVCIALCACRFWGFPILLVWSQQTFTQKWLDSPANIILLSHSCCTLETLHHTRRGLYFSREKLKPLPLTWTVLNAIHNYQDKVLLRYLHVFGSITRNCGRFDISE